MISSVSTFQSSLEAAALALCRKQEEAGECDVMLEVFFVVARRHHASSWLNSALKGSVLCISDVSSVPLSRFPYEQVLTTRDVVSQLDVVQYLVKL